MAIGKDATEEELAEYLIALMKAKGVACSTVKNGHNANVQAVVAGRFTQSHARCSRGMYFH